MLRVSVASGQLRKDYGPRLRTAAVVVEAADCSLCSDTTVKLVAYADDLIAEDWILDVYARQLLVFRNRSPTRRHVQGYFFLCCIRRSPKAGRSLFASSF